MQLHNELKGVGRTLERMAKRVDQALSITKGTRREMETTVESARTRLRQNVSLTEDPNSPAGRAAAAAAVSEVEVAENLEKRFERPISEAELAVELKLEAAKERRRREAVNKPVVEAVVELEETAVLAVASLRAHEEKLTNAMQKLHDIYNHLASHYDAHQKVATARDRAKVGRVVDHPTHESLRLAAEIDDSARKAANDAVKEARSAAFAPRSLQGRRPESNARTDEAVDGVPSDGQGGDHFPHMEQRGAQAWQGLRHCAPTNGMGGG